MPSTRFFEFAQMQGWETLEISGADSKDFLHRLTSANFKILQPGEITPATLLQANGKLVQYFKAIALGPATYLLLLAPLQEGKAAANGGFEDFEKLHFIEDLKISPLPSEWIYLRAVGAEKSALEKFSPPLAALWEGRGQESSRAFHKNHDGSWIGWNEAKWSCAPIAFDLGILVKTAQASTLISGLRAAGFHRVPSLEKYRIWARDPGPLYELTPKTLPLEAGLDDALHENKGCYPGQEVIERIRSMGQVPRVLVQVFGQGKSPLPSTPLLAENSEAGTLTSCTDHPFESGWVGLGYLKRTFANTNQKFTMADGQTVDVKIERSGLKTS
ncbi:MAG: hypothetical protein AB1540_14830 [Bdellovibrionota bacterium]